MGQGGSVCHTAGSCLPCSFFCICEALFTTATSVLLKCRLYIDDREDHFWNSSKPKDCHWKLFLPSVFAKMIFNQWPVTPKIMCKILADFSILPVMGQFVIQFLRNWLEIGNHHLAEMENGRKPNHLLRARKYIQSRTMVMMAVVRLTVLDNQQIPFLQSRTRGQMRLVDATPQDRLPFLASGSPSSASP